MKRAGWFALAFAVCASGCQQKAATPTRAELRSLGGNTFEIIPAEDQLPYCLAFTHSETGIIRQLTMTHENRSVPCTAGRPIAGVRFRIPENEGAVKVHVFFSDQKLNATTLAQEFYERRGDPSFRPMDLRLPGTVNVQTFEFRPEPGGGAAQTGGRIGASGEVLAADAGATTMQQDAGDAETNEGDAGADDAAAGADGTRGMADAGP